MTGSIRVIIKGRVQGVGYRAWTVSHANRKALKGWVRNRNDGSVEAVFSGDKTVVEEMIDACKKGPLLARVDSIESYAWNESVEGDALIARPTV